MGMNMGMGMGPDQSGFDQMQQMNDFQLQQRMEQLRIAEEQLKFQQMQIQQQQALVNKQENELEAHTKLEELKKQTFSWQIAYDEIDIVDNGTGGVTGGGLNGDMSQKQESMFFTVYKGMWRGTSVEVKQVNASCEKDTSDIKTNNLYNNEVGFLSSLHHPNLVLFLGACVTPKLCILTEHMHGGSLRQMLSSSKQVPDPVRRHTYILDIALAMAYLHNSKPQVIHGNLTSFNVLLDDMHEHAKVTDFSLRGIKNDLLNSEMSIYSEAAMNPSWASPELLKKMPFNEKTDVYSFAIIAYEIFTGKLPYGNIQQAQIISNVVVNDERPTLPRNAPQRWKDLIKSAWATDYNARPSFVSIIESLDLLDPQK